MAHDLVWLEGRRTPKVVPSGSKYKPKPSEGKITRRRKATAEEEKTISRGDWVRVNENGEKPSDSGYMKKKSKVRPQHNHAGVDMMAFAGGYEGVTHAGLAVVSVDGRSVLLAQRSPDETDAADVAETWEFPGGGLDEGEDAQVGAFREFYEEIGVEPPPGTVIDGWRSEDGVYQGFVYRLKDEFDPTGFVPTDEVQAIGWFTREMIAANDNLRPEVRDETDWDLIFGVSGNEEHTMDEAAQYASITVPPIPVHGVVAPEEAASGDKRGFNAGAMTRRPLRLPLRDTNTDMGAHGGAFVVGSVDMMMRADGLVHWEGLLMPSEAAEGLAGKIEFFGKYGVSVDGDQGSIDTERTESEDTLWFDKVRASGLTAVDIPAFHEAYVAFGPHPKMPRDEAVMASAYDDGSIVGGRAEYGRLYLPETLNFDRGPGWVTDPKATKNIHDYWTKKGEEGYAKVAWGTPGDFTRAKSLIGAKIAQHSPEKMKYLNQIIAQWHFDALGYWPGDLGKPGNAPDTAENRRRAAVHADLEDIDFEELARLLGQESRDELQPVEDTEGDEATTAWETVLVSSAAGGARPPLSYFHRHPATEALTIEDPDENGFMRTYGYAAEWGVCHIGYEGRCVEPPMAGSDDYPEFHLGKTRTAEGTIRTGVLTYGVGHRDAATILSESPTQAYFDNVKNAWAAVRVGEDERGIWFSGVVLPKVDPEDLTLIEASGQVSGEWKGGAMRACLTVNVPGFPVVSASAEYDEEGNVMALAASAFGQVPDAPCSQTEDVSGNDDPVGDLALAVAERIEARKQMAALAFEALREEWEN